MPSKSIIFRMFFHFFIRSSKCSCLNCSGFDEFSMRLPVVVVVVVRLMFFSVYHILFDDLCMHFSLLGTLVMMENSHHKIDSYES